MRTIIADPTRSLILGRPGENEATQILFPIAKWIEQFGTAGIFTLVHKRYNDEEVYPCAVTWNTEYVSWIINSYDVLNVGIGKAVLSYTISGQIVKSKTFDTVVMETVVVPTEAPDPYQDWVSQMTEMVNDVQLDVTAIQEKLDTVETGAEVNIIEEIDTADGNALPVENKVVTLPDTSPLEIKATSTKLNYEMSYIKSEFDKGRQIIFSGLAVLRVTYNADTDSKFLVLNQAGTLTEYKVPVGTMNYSVYGLQHYMADEMGAEHNIINAIHTADGTELTPTGARIVTLPDFALKGEGDNLFVVNITASGTPHEVILDKSNKDIMEAFNAGKNVWAKNIDGYYAPLAEIDDSAGTTYPKIKFRLTYIDSDGITTEQEICLWSNDAESNSGEYYESSASICVEIIDPNNPGHFKLSANDINTQLNMGKDVTVNGSRILSKFMSSAGNYWYYITVVHRNVTVGMSSRIVPYVVVYTVATNSTSYTEKLISLWQDVEPIQDSANLITSGAVYYAINTAVSGKEDTSNKVTSISDSSTDTQYPSAKAVYDLVGDVNTAITAINNIIGI